MVCPPLFLKLIRDKTGVGITTRLVAEAMNRDLHFIGKINIHTTPVASGSIAFCVFKLEQALLPRTKSAFGKRSFAGEMIIDLCCECSLGTDTDKL